MDLNIIWFILIAVLICGYAILDGFDLGAGTLMLFLEDEDERSRLISSIGPFWDGNEVWLITAGGALFAAFPEVYSTVFSGFYTALMLLLFALIFRAVSIEFRGKKENKKWRIFWDKSFAVSSLIIAILTGVAIGNIAVGIPLGSTHEFTGSFFSLLNPFAVISGLTSAALFVLHGNLYCILKTEGELKEKFKLWTIKTFAVYILFYIIATFTSLFTLPHMTNNFKDYPFLYIIPLSNIAILAAIPYMLNRSRYFLSFMLSCLNIAALIMIFAIGIFPDLVRANPEYANTLNIYNSASSEKTLGIMLIIACIGMPLVIGYTVLIYRIFRETNDVKY